MSTLQELVTKYTFQVEDEALDKAKVKLDGVISFAGKLAAAGTAAAVAIFGMAKFTANAGDEALVTSQKLGLTVENLSRLQFAAKLSNIEAGNFNVALRFMSKNLDDATKGTGTAFEAFKKLKVGIKDSNGQLIPTDKVLLSLSEKFKELPDGAVKTALAMDIFGRSGADMIPLLNEGSAGLEKMMKRSDELGFTMSTELAKAGDQFNDSLDETIFALIGLRNVVGAKLLPVLRPLIESFTKFLVQNRAIISSKLTEFFDVLQVVVKATWFVFERLVNLTFRLIDMVGGLSNALMIAAAIFIAMNASAALTVAGIALLLAIFEDIFTYFTDDQANTVFGSMIESVKAAYNSLNEFFGSMSSWGQALVNYLLTPLRGVVIAFRALEKLWNFDPTSKKGWTDLGSDLGGLATQFATGGNTIGEAIGVTPTSDSAVTSRQERNYFNAQPSIVNNISVGENSDVAGIGKILGQSTKDGVDQSLRGAQRSVGKKGAY
jgi:hypothetical protein